MLLLHSFHGPVPNVDKCTCYIFSDFEPFMAIGNFSRLSKVDTFNTLNG
jgi:hypothetical protein